MTDTSARLSAALVGRYRIERELGAGGMATVWLAHDFKHDRKVAIKVLHPHLAALVGADRFLKEIKTTANLQHPHILALHDSGDADGLLFYVMPFVDGESLRQRITRDKQLPIPDAVRITSEVAGALDYAHRQGVIHRDIKPENILLHEGSALVADFGIALAPATGDTRLTETGMSMGTPHYMSPEQALGERELDARSDIYAVGAMLYEMVTGTPPFTGPSARAIVTKVISQKPVPPSRLRKEVPAQVDDAVLTALQKDPADRFPTAAALQEALVHGGSIGLADRRAWLEWSLAGMAMLAVVAAVYWFSSRNAVRQISPRVAAAGLSIAALPFTNYGGDPADAFLADAFPEEILTALGSLQGVTVRPVPSGARFRDHPDLPARATELGVGTILIGTFQRQRDSIKVTVTFYDVASNSQSSSKTFIDDSKNKFALEDSVAAAVVNRFKLTQSQAQLAVSRARRTTNPAAHDLYSLGLFFFGKRTCPDILKGIDDFKQAIDADSLYASAWSGLSDAYTVLAIFGCVPPIDGFIPARKAADRALQLDPTLAQAHTSLGMVDMWYVWDRPAALVELRRAVAIDPQYAPAHLFLGWYYAYGGDTTRSNAEFQRARELDPLSVILTTRVGSGLYSARRYKEAISWFRKALELDSTAVMPHAELARAWLQLGNCDSTLAQARFIPPKFPNYEGAIAGYALGFCGHHVEAERMLGELLHERARGELVLASNVAQLYLGLGEKDSAFAWLELARKGHETGPLEFKTESWYDSLRGDPRFARLISEVAKEPGN